MPQSKPTRLLRLPEVIDTTGLKRATIYRNMAQGSFPKPVKLGERSVAWPDTVIDQWIDDRIQEANLIGTEAA